MKKESVAVVIISNGPGELSTWVKPVVNQFNKLINDSNSKIQFSLRLSLVPCPNATGNEFKVAKSWNEFDVVISAANFWRLLIKPSRFAHWPKRGIVVFLGGDQFWSVLLAKRLGYKSITYAEWNARWPRFNNITAAMNKKVKEKLSKKNQRKCIVIGDLMADIHNQNVNSSYFDNETWIAILPGSKKTKLSIGIPYFLQLADYIAKHNSTAKIMIPLAPTTNLEDYLYFQSVKNPITKYYSSKIKFIKKIKDSIFDYIIETHKKTRLHILANHPNYEIISQCSLAITTVGANTSELAALNLPMMVVLPTQHLIYMKAWDGFLGIFARIPFLNRLFITVVKAWYLRNKKYFAWPNIKGKKMIVPERIGNYSPEEIGQEILKMLNNKDYLTDQRINLSKQRGKRGAAMKLAKLIFDLANQ